MIKTVNVAEIKNHLSEFIAGVERGDEVVICKRNIPVAKMTSIPKPRKNTSKPGWAKGTIRVRGDITSPAIPIEEWNMLRSDFEAK